MPSLGERVFVRPGPGLVVQRAHGTFGQFLDPSGQEVMWDQAHQAQLDRGEILVSAPPVRAPEAE